MESVLSVQKPISAAAVAMQLCPCAPRNFYLVSGTTRQSATVEDQFPPRFDRY